MGTGRPLMLLCAATLAIAALATVGCDRRAGDRCLPSSSGKLIACESPTSVLICEDWRLIAVPCRGPEGCSESSTASCDTSIGNEGDRCLGQPYTEAAESACSADKKHTLMCKTDGLVTVGRFEQGRLCRGPNGCVTEGGFTECDQSVAQIGDRCNTGSSPFGACSVDRKFELACLYDERSPLELRGGNFVAQRECPTAKGCEMRPVQGQREALAPNCDYGDSKPGSPCGRGYENTETCGRDRTTILKCNPKSRSFKLMVTCAPGDTCQPFDGETPGPVCVPTKK